MSMTGGIWKEKLIRIENHFSNLRTLVKVINAFFSFISYIYENIDSNLTKKSGILNRVRKMYAYILTNIKYQKPSFFRINICYVFSNIENLI